MFTNKVAIVTGAASGIGQAVSAHLAKLGARVVLADINKEKLFRQAENLSAQPGQVLAQPTDVSDDDQVKALVEAAAAFGAKNGAIDFLVNSHGILQFGPLETATREQWNRILGVNTIGAWSTMAAVVPAMRKAGQGAIVNISSVNGIRAYEGAAIYNASKAALNMLSEVFALELAPYNIRVNTVLPGTVQGTGFIPSMVAQDQLDAFYKRLAPVHPLGRNATPDDVANCVLFLLSDQAAYVTGTRLNVDGGRQLATNRPVSGRENEKD